MTLVSKFKLAGLNRGGCKSAGFTDTYATVDLPNYDWSSGGVPINPVVTEIFFD